jgi:hypothetical protein
MRTKNEIPVKTKEAVFSSVRNPLKMERAVFSPKQPTMRKHGVKILFFFFFYFICYIYTNDLESFIHCVIRKVVDILKI